MPIFHSLFEKRLILESVLLAFRLLKFNSLYLILYKVLALFFFMNIKNEKLDVEGAFKNYFYIIPDYQREYVWKENNVSRFLDDIYEEFEANAKSEYFIGSIVVCKNDDKSREVIDGQQRLTTLFLILCSLKKLFFNKNKAMVELLNPKIYEIGFINEKLSSSYKLVLQYEDSRDLIEKIENNTYSNNSFKQSSKNIINAYEYITNFFEINFKEEKKLIQFSNYLLNKVNLIQIETSDISDALKIFETINERGVGLNSMDLLKNLIFRNIEKKDFNKLKNEWEKIITLLDSQNIKYLRFLRYFIMANYVVKNKKGDEILREDEIYNWIIKSENVEQCNYEKKPFEFVKQIVSNAEVYVNFIQGKDGKGEYNVYLDNINKLGGSFSQHLILLLAAKDLPNNEFNHLAKQIESLIFYFILTKTSTRDLERDFSKWAKDVKLVSVSTNQKEKLNEFIEKKLLPEIQSKEELFEKSFKDLGYNSLQKYRLKYVLAKITKYIDMMALNKNDPDSMDNYLGSNSKIEIEHILPNNPDSSLKNEFESKYNPDYGPDSYDRFKVKLGNLVLLEKPINTSIGRNYYEIKKKEYCKSTIRLTRSIALIENVGNDTSINKINKLLKSWDSWGPKEILERQEMLFNLTKKIWSISKLE